MVVALVVGLPFLLRLSLLQHRGFNPDELEHLHFSWSVSRGQVPYVDYFEHHTPLYHVMLAPIVAAHDTDRSPDDAVALLFAARRVAWLFAGLVLLFTLLAGRHVARGAVPLLALVMLSGSDVFLVKSLESRPDVPATACVMLALWLQVDALSRLWQGRRASGRLLASELALGVASLFTQKVLFFGPGLALAWIVWLVRRDPAGPNLRARLVGLAAQATGFLLPWAAIGVFFARRGALHAFLDANFFVNSRWPGLPARAFVEQILATDPVFVALAFAGVALALRPRDGFDARPWLALAFLSPVACLAVHPAVTYHYFLLFVPLAAILGADALAAAADRLEARRPRLRAGVVLPVVALLVSVPGLLRLQKNFDRGNWSTLQNVRFLVRNVAPGETTLDGFSALAPFRRGAFFYPFQNAHTRAIQGEAYQDELLQQLTRGTAVPKVVFWDEDLRQGTREDVAAFLLKHYAPMGVDPARLRIFDAGAGFWSDEAARPFGHVPGQERLPHVYFGEGWRDPVVQDGVAARGTRTRRSTLVVPIRRPRDFDAVLRARAIAGAPAFEVELVVNGTSAGRLPVGAGWQGYRFRVPRRALRGGFEGFELRFSASGASDDARLELLVQSLTLEPV